MYRIVQGTTHGLKDVAHFIEVINTLPRSSLAEARSLFDPEKEVIVARAPGRLDVMGGIADYSGSLVLEMPIREATFAALLRSRSRSLRIVSLSKDPLRESFFEMSLEDFEHDGGPL